MEHALYKPGDVVTVVSYRPDLRRSIWAIQMDDTLGKKLTIKSISEYKYYGEICYKVKENSWTYQESFFDGLVGMMLSEELDDEEVRIDGLNSFVSAFPIT